MSHGFREFFPHSPRRPRPHGVLRRRFNSHRPGTPCCPSASAPFACTAPGICWAGGSRVRPSDSSARVLGTISSLRPSCHGQKRSARISLRNRRQRRCKQNKRPASAGSRMQQNACRCVRAIGDLGAGVVGSTVTSESRVETVRIPCALGARARPPSASATAAAPSHGGPTSPHRDLPAVQNKQSGLLGRASGCGSPGWRPGNRFHRRGPTAIWRGKGRLSPPAISPASTPFSTGNCPPSHRPAAGARRQLVRPCCD